MQLSTLVLVALLTLTLSTFNLVGACPWDQPNLKPFSYWPNWNVTNGIVMINQSTIISSSPPVALKAIIVNNNSALVFDNKIINLNVSYIRVESGSNFTMGSDACNIVRKIILTFTGPETYASEIGTDPYDNANLGSKGLALLSGSSVQIVGKIPADGLTWTLLNQTALKNSSTISLKSSVGWRVGDTIVLASTDYGPVLDSATNTNPDIAWQIGVPFPDQNEKCVIKSVSSDGLTLTLTAPLKYTHYVDGYTQAEVGLLTRNIVFQGDDSSSTSEFGGHMIIRLVKKLQVKGVEFYQMGQKGHMGRYPIHTHLLKNSYLNQPPFEISQNAIHSSFLRCMSIHDTNGMTIDSNVCFNFFGHGYYLEDGSEVFNSFTNNIGILAKPITYKSIIPSDVDPGIFWITNPTNYFVGNRAVGGKFGYFFSFPLHPIGLSLNHYPDMYPRNSPLGSFIDNVAHSADSGMWIEEQLEDDGNTTIGGYFPNVTATFIRFVGYKNRNYGAWVKGGTLILQEFLCFDNRVQITAPTGDTVTVGAVMIGETNNAGDSSFRPTVDLGGRSRPDLDFSSGLFPIIGYEEYEDAGPQFVLNSTFINLVSNTVRPAGGFSYRKTRQVQNAMSKNMALQFINANKYYIISNPTSGIGYDDHRLGLIGDLDGSITGFPYGGYVVGNDTILKFDQCIYNSSWNAFSCPAFGEGYVQLRFANLEYDTFDVLGKDGVQHTELRLANKRQYQQYTWDLLRNISTPVTGSIGKENDQYLNQDNVPSRGFYAIRMPFDIPTPKYFKVSISGSNGDWVVLAIPFRSGSTFLVQYSDSSTAKPRNLQLATSLDNVMLYPNYYYYFDSAAEMLYLKVAQQTERDNFVNVYNTFVSYGSRGGLSVQATCPSGSCSPVNLRNPSNARSLYKTYMKEDRYVGVLETCQQNLVTPQSFTPAYGRVIAFFDSRTASLDVTVHHSLNAIVTSLIVGVGQYGVAGREIILPYPIPSYSVSRFIVDLSYNEHVSLVKGELYLKVSSTAYPNGHLRAQLLCRNTTATSYCTLPPQVPLYSCVDSSATYLYSDTVSPTITPTGTTQFNTVTGDSSMCGSTSLSIQMKEGDLTINSLADIPISSTATVLEFLVRATDYNMPLNLTITMGYKRDFNSIVLERKHIQYYKIDTLNASRVRIAFNEFIPDFTLGQKIRYVRIELTDKSITRQFVIDNVRLTTTVEQMVNAPITSNDWNYFGKKATCGSSINPDSDPFKISSL